MISYRFMKLKSKKFVVATFFLMALMVVSALASCAPTSPVSNAPTPHPYKFAGIFQLTGSQAFYGSLARYGMELAIEDINKAGGINGRQVIGIYEDSAGDRAKATTAANKLISVDNVDALFTITPGMAGAVAPIAEGNRIPYIYIGSVNEFAINKTSVFKDYPSPQDLCEILMRKAISLGHQHIALFGPNDEVTNFCLAGAQRQGNVSIFETYPAGDKDYSSQFTKIKTNNPTAIIIYSLAGDCPNAFKAVKELGIKTQIFLPVQSFACGSADNSVNYADILQDSYGSDIALDESSTDPKFISFKKRLEERNWVVNLRGSALEYDIVNEMAKAYSGCQTRDCAILHLRTLKMEGLTGNLTYQGGQIVTRDVMLTKFSDGNWIKAE